MRHLAGIRRGLFFALLAGVIVSSAACQDFKTEVMYRQAQGAHNKEDFAKAIAIYEEILEMNPQNTRVRYELAVAYIDNKEQKKATREARMLRKFKRPDLAEEIEKLIRKSEFHVIRTVERP